MNPRHLSAVLLFACGCSRSPEMTVPRPAPERIAVADASTPPAASVDAGRLAVSLSPSPFAIVARMPMSGVVVHPSSAIGSPPPLVQRLAGGGIVVASEYARARADGPGPLVVQLVSAGIEDEIRARPNMMQLQGYDATRWVWSDGALSLFVYEEETGRSGPRLTTYKEGPQGFRALRGASGYFSAVKRGGSVLALARTAYEVPNSSMYPKGSGYEQNAWAVKPPVIAVLAGSDPAPVVPAGACPVAMSAAPDGALVVAVEECKRQVDGQVGAVRYGPGATRGTVEWFARESTPRDAETEIVAHAASASEMYVAYGARMMAWNGNAWAASEPIPGGVFGSVSRAPNGDLWVTLRNDGRLMKRTAHGGAWTEVPLPEVPDDPLDEEPYSSGSTEREIVKVDALPEGERLRDGRDVAARFVDATGDELLVLGVSGREAMLMSSRRRGPVARLPSIATQRARLIGDMKARYPTSPKDCAWGSYLVFPEGTAASAVRGALMGDAGASARLGEIVLEGRPRLAAVGDEARQGASKLAPLGAKRVCGPPVLEKRL